jgi:hypothetical protein
LFESLIFEGSFISLGPPSFSKNVLCSHIMLVRSSLTCQNTFHLFVWKFPLVPTLPIFPSFLLFTPLIDWLSWLHTGGILKCQWSCSSLICYIGQQHTHGKFELQEWSLLRWASLWAERGKVITSNEVSPMGFFGGLYMTANALETILGMRIALLRFQFKFWISSMTSSECDTPKTMASPSSRRTAVQVCAQQVKEVGDVTGLSITPLTSHHHSLSAEPLGLVLQVDWWLLWGPLC